ncbi:MAG: hypothetical protein ACYSOY_05350 [Planctomycetota bacterium]
MMLENTEWAGGVGLRDRVLIPSEQQMRVVDPVAESLIEKVKELIFPLHGI